MELNIKIILIRLINYSCKKESRISLIRIAININDYFNIKIVSDKIKAIKISSSNQSYAIK